MTWSQAFARQALSEFGVRDLILKIGGVPQCHQLHFLQMALEKIAKAHLIAAGGDPHKLQQSHAYIAKVVPVIVKEMLRRSPGRKDGWVVDTIRNLARRIELLAPSVDDGGRFPANCEYPWENQNNDVVAPMDHDFKLFEVFERSGITMIKSLRQRAIELAGGLPG